VAEAAYILRLEDKDKTMRNETHNGKERKMKATKTNTRKADDEATTAAWLKAPANRIQGGCPRIQRLGWKRLARMYFAARAGGPVRKAINAECRRCGYTPRVILTLNAD